MRRLVREQSLSLVFLGLFLAARTAHNDELVEHEQPALSWLGYLGSADFWQTTLQNLQSEFLAVGLMAVFAIYLRQRGSPESKPVGCPHHTTSLET